MAHPSETAQPTQWCTIQSGYIKIIAAGSHAAGENNGVRIKVRHKRAAVYERILYVCERHTLIVRIQFEAKRPNQQDLQRKLKS